MGSTGELKALLLTHDEATLTGFQAVCSELGIDAQQWPLTEDVHSHLNQNKYAAVVVDFDNRRTGEEYLPALQQSEVNRNCVLVAVATNARNLEQALHYRAHFVLKRPLLKTDIRRTLRSAYDFMLTDRRRAFRSSSILPVRIRLVRSGSVFECSSMNVSANGVAIYSLMRMKPTETVDLEIVLPSGFVVHATGIVVWDDGNGKSGIHFQCKTPEMRKNLDTWLAAQEMSSAKGDLPYRDFADILPPAGAKSTIAGESGR